MNYMRPIQLVKFLCKAQPGGRLMAVDVGTKFLGVTMSDLEMKAGVDMSDLEVKVPEISSLIQMNDKSGEPKSDAVIASEIKELVDRNNVKGMVIGKPKDGLQSSNINLSSKTTGGLDIGQPDGLPLSSNVQEANIMKFVQKLTETNIISDMNYTYAKDGFSSKSALIWMWVLKEEENEELSKKRAKNMVAERLLQTYLDYVNMEV